MKDDLVRNLEKYWNGLRSLFDALVHVDCGPWGSRVPRPPPRWRSSSRVLIEAVVRGAANRTRLAGGPA